MADRFPSLEDFSAGWYPVTTPITTNRYYDLGDTKPCLP